MTAILAKLAGVAKSVIKNMGLIAIDDSDMFGKAIGILLGFIIIIVGVIVLVSSFLFSIPDVLIGGIFGNNENTNSEYINKQISTISYYVDAAKIVNNEADRWLSDMKKKYSDYDDVTVNDNFNITWKELISIDSILLEQQFNNANMNDIIDIGNRFIVKNVHTDVYTVIESVEVEKQKYDSDSNSWITYTTTKEIPVEKLKANIRVYSRSFNDVANYLINNNEDSNYIKIANNIYSNLLKENINIEKTLEEKKLVKIK